MEPGMPLCPPNHTKKRKIRDLLDTPDPKEETSGYHIPYSKNQTIPPSTLAS